jgi:hypothetical protein
MLVVKGKTSNAIEARGRQVFEKPAAALTGQAQQPFVPVAIDALVREIPEGMKPRRISIGGSPASNVRQIDGKAVA